MIVSAEVVSMVHQVTDVLLQVTNRSRDDAVARERLLLQQQQIMHRDLVEMQLKEKTLLTEKEKKQMELLAQKESKQMDKDLAEKQIALKEKALLTEREMKEKQMMIDRDLAEKRMQLEREMKAAETLEKDKQLQFERDLKTAEAVEKDKQLMIESQLKEKQMQMEATEQERIRYEERMEREKDKLKIEYEAKLELNKQNLLLQSELKMAKSVSASVGLREPPVAVLVDVSDSVTAATDASFLQKQSRLGSSFGKPVNLSMGSATPMAVRTTDLACDYVMSPYSSPITCEKQETPSVTWTSPSAIITQTHTTNYSSAHNGLISPTFTNLPHAGLQAHRD